MFKTFKLSFASNTPCWPPPAPGGIHVGILDEVDGERADCDGGDEGEDDVVVARQFEH